MTTASPSAAAYADFTRDIASLGCAKLHASELAVLRAAADAAIFGDEHQAIWDAVDLFDDLVEADRMTEDRVERLRVKLRAIEPVLALPLSPRLPAGPPCVAARATRRSRCLARPSHEELIESGHAVRQLAGRRRDGCPVVRSTLEDLEPGIVQTTRRVRPHDLAKAEIVSGHRLDAEAAALDECFLPHPMQQKGKLPVRGASDDRALARRQGGGLQRRVRNSTSQTLDIDAHRPVAGGCRHDAVGVRQADEDVGPTGEARSTMIAATRRAPLA